MQYHLITIGCQMNKADSERIASFLEKRGYVASSSWLGVDLVVLTTCGVRQSAEDRVYGLVNRIRQGNPKAAVVITGCLARREDVKRRLRGKVDLFMPINELPNIFALLKDSHRQLSLSTDAVRELSGEKYLTIIPKYQSTFTAYIPIGNGCNNFCSYCVVPYARGREVYRPAADVIKEAKALLKRGYKEIILIAQNVNSYRSGRTNFLQLLSKLAALPGNFWLRFSSSHPKDLSPELIKVLASSDKICHHLHVAVQSGDDEILKAMNRHYTAAHFSSLIKKIRKAKPGIALTTDVIVGFPGETKKQFQNSVKLFKNLQFDMAYIAQYSPRPGTASWYMKDNVSREEKHRREQILTEILRKSGKKANRAYWRRTVIVLVEGKNRRGGYYGKTSSFKTVSFTAPSEVRPEDIIGNFVSVKIQKVQDFGLEGVLKK
ncbi:MAG TPA: tRNA (N6-isopentenyl adenosine(37)-C2)-methylthiotransferase MiaB [bacterium]|nr:MAG: (Dimethylallyl)adenosine tRNA methylthiotransferase MiaB [Parcubacteria group bacterium ADurb.Bin115]HNU81260.1 tRNA (N6-isopentenyl adenosine(37)-C2)-methylthiotransferase MiaB [bacterium]HOD86922.1 tRNA (N6-isopentenyl adenosine(37)-C2)-methylthiotransferase MiaB [bacterium]HPW05538.1 tRNA (N6-isopentenyl adenosine(37)-C2)-methylthiotransferase MiaB [bacterium]HPY99223.1 tRNA (N6-isopentenyl adenosine(37)-C2)-methylthiotransferase MiaB [bacterium]